MSLRNNIDEDYKQSIKNKAHSTNYDKGRTGLSLSSIEHSNT